MKWTTKGITGEVSCDEKFPVLEGSIIHTRCLVGFGSTVEAVGVRLQLLIPTGGSAEVNGFNEADLQTSGLGLSLLLPATESLRIVAEL